MAWRGSGGARRCSGWGGSRWVGQKGKVKGMVSGCSGEQCGNGRAKRQLRQERKQTQADRGSGVLSVCGFVCIGGGGGAALWQCVFCCCCGGGTCGPEALPPLQHAFACVGCLPCPLFGAVGSAGSAGSAGNAGSHWHQLSGSGQSPPAQQRQLSAHAALPSARRSFLSWM